MAGTTVSQEGTKKPEAPKMTPLRHVPEDPLSYSKGGAACLVEAGRVAVEGKWEWKSRWFVCVCVCVRALLTPRML